MLDASYREMTESENDAMSWLIKAAHAVTSQGWCISAGGPQETCGPSVLWLRRL